MPFLLYHVHSFIVSCLLMPIDNDNDDDNDDDDDYGVKNDDIIDDGNN